MSVPKNTLQKNLDYSPKIGDDNKQTDDGLSQKHYKVTTQTPLFGPISQSLKGNSSLFCRQRIVAWVIDGDDKSMNFLSMWISS